LNYEEVNNIKNTIITKSNRISMNLLEIYCANYIAI